MKREIKNNKGLKIKVIKMRSGSVTASATKENGNMITFNCKGLSDKEIIEYANKKLDYPPVRKINLTSRISKSESLALC